MTTATSSSSTTTSSSNNNGSKKQSVILFLCLGGIGLVLLEALMVRQFNTSSFSGAWQTKRDEADIFPLLLQNVLLHDIVWIPHQSTLVFLAARPDLFARRKLLVGVREQDKLQEINGVRREDLGSPMTLQDSWRIELLDGDTGTNSFRLESCYQVPTPEVSDWHVSNATYIVQCRYGNQKNNHLMDSGNNGTIVHDDRMVPPPQDDHVDSNNRLQLWYDDRPITTFSQDRKNAASSMQLQRPVKSTNFSVSVAIKGVFEYSEHVIDVVDYYQKQGIEHVYLGVFPMGGDLQDKYEGALRKFTQPNFVSLGGMDESAVTFQTLGKNGWKLSYMQSILYHSKSSLDDLLIVVDVDELVTTNTPTTKSIVSALYEYDLKHRKTSCYYKLSANVATSLSSTQQQQQDENNGTNTGMTSLALKSPNRCEGGGHAAYFKSVAVLEHSGFIGFHKHGECRQGTGDKKVDRAVGMTILHFTDFWRERWSMDVHTSDIARKAGTNETSEPVMMCNITNEYTTFVKSGVSFVQE